MLDFVDQNDTVIGQGTYTEAREQGTITRNAVIFVRDTRGRYILSRRAPEKKVWPNCVDVSCVGSVESGETYEEAAKRELAEELHLAAPLTFLKKAYTEFLVESTMHRFMTGFFLTTTGTLPKPNHEIAALERYTLEELKKAFHDHPEHFTPGLADDLRQVGHLLDEN